MPAKTSIVARYAWTRNSVDTLCRTICWLKFTAMKCEPSFRLVACSYALCASAKGGSYQGGLRCCIAPHPLADPKHLGFFGQWALTKAANLDVNAPFHFCRPKQKQRGNRGNRNSWQGRLQIKISLLFLPVAIMITIRLITSRLIKIPALWNEHSTRHRTRHNIHARSLSGGTENIFVIRSVPKSASFRSGHLRASLSQSGMKEWLPKTRANRAMRLSEPKEVTACLRVFRHTSSEHNMTLVPSKSARTKIMGTNQILVGWILKFAKGLPVNRHQSIYHVDFFRLLLSCSW